MKLRNMPWWLVGVVLVVLTRLAMMSRVPNACEDAFITFRYAANLVNGHGAVYNLGEKVFGYTSPAWMLWAALGIKLTGDPVTWARMSALVLDCIALVCGGLLLERHWHKASAWVFAVFFGVYPIFGGIAASGMESGATFALMLVAAYLVDRKTVWAGPVMGLLALMRPEGLLAALFIGVRAKGRAQMVAGMMIAVAAAVLFGYYGTIEPQSVLAKSVVYGTPGPQSGSAWWSWMVPWSVGVGPGTPMEPAALSIVKILLIPCVLVGGWTAFRSKAPGMAVAGVAVWALYALTGTSFFAWYMAIPIGTAAFLAAIGLPRVAGHRVVYLTAALALLGEFPQQSQVYMARSNIESDLFGSAGMYLAGVASPGDAVFLEPIGLVGTLNGHLRVLDEVGLVTPQVVAARQRGAGWYADVVRAERPRWLVTRLEFLRSGRQFAGKSAPFRNAREFAAVIGGYTPRMTFGLAAGKPDIVVLERK